MSCGTLVDLFGFLGGLATLLPSIHAGWLGLKAQRAAPSRDARGGAADLHRAVASYFERIIQIYRPEHFFVTIAGVALITAGFGVDLFVASCGD